MATNKDVANTILQQLGGRRFIAMTGAKNFLCDDNSLSFQVMRNESKITHVKIILTFLDLYEMEFYKCRKYNIDKVATKTGLYNDMLQPVFTSVTGLNTYL